MVERGMGEWAPLPADLGRDARALAESCRLLKERTGLSLAALAERTHYSKSSWQRCLNGRQIPPRSALRFLAEAAGADPARLLGLREAVLRSGRAPLTPPGPRQPSDGRVPSGGRVPSDGRGVPEEAVPQDAMPQDVMPQDGAPAESGRTAREERRPGKSLPASAAPTAPPAAAAVRRWRLAAAVLLALLLAVTGTALAVIGQGHGGCEPVTTHP
ncbi:helix-turn-helix transcriptional regulator [Streptomyces avermitilis]|uniref:helix-turn-helix domain-containing protein n=1 Tax=Streptomyces avermitilis TaxID=33903 RepID=UPI00340AA91A